ncbi:MAG: hypothetical protein FJZ01_19645 [Candidatus Sericytochromatia bacterium]|nr:hypothetical protein [Candidatus Tanganyikabacteria bacterium]
MTSRTFPLLAAGLLAAGALGACANAVTVPPPQRTLLFRATVARQLAQQNQDIRYIVALDLSGNPDDGPKPYGPWPLEKPAVGWDLPFYVTDKTPGINLVYVSQPVEPGNVWTHMFVLNFVGGAPVFQQWEQVFKAGTRTRDRIEPRQNLSQGQDFRLINSGVPTSAPGTPAGPGSGPVDTIELTLVLNRFIPEDDLKNLKQLEANLVTAVRPPDAAINGDPTGWKLDQWFSANNTYFSLALNKDLPLERRDALDATPLYPQNIPPGITQDDVTFKAYASEYKEQ